MGKNLIAETFIFIFSVKWRKISDSSNYVFEKKILKHQKVMHLKQGCLRGWRIPWDVQLAFIHDMTLFGNAFPNCSVDLLTAG